MLRTSPEMLVLCQRLRGQRPPAYLTDRHGHTRSEHTKHGQLAAIILRKTDPRDFVTRSRLGDSE